MRPLGRPGDASCVSTCPVPVNCGFGKGWLASGKRPHGRLSLSFAWQNLYEAWTGAG